MRAMSGGEAAVAVEKPPMMKSPKCLRTITALLLFSLSFSSSVSAGEVGGEVSVGKAKLRKRSVNKNPDRKKTLGQYKKKLLRRARAGGDGGPPKGEKIDERDFVVVYLTKAKSGSKLKASKKRTEIIQKDRRFRDHVTPVVLGSEVRFSNDDSFFHHIYSPDSSKLNAPKHSTYVDRKPDRLGKFELFCDIHPLMNAFIYVVPNDFYSTVQKGKYRIKNIPAGTYEMRVWHPRSQAQTKTLTIPAEGKTTVNFSL